MPSDVSHIYIDSTFTSSEEGYKDVTSSIEFVVADNIGNYNIPMVYQTTAPLSADVIHDIEYRVDNAVSGTNDIPIYFFRELSSDFGTVPSITEYYVVDNTISGTVDSYMAYFTGYNVVSGTIDEKIIYIAGEHYTSFKAYFVEHSCVITTSGSNSYWQNYMNYSGHVDLDGLPIPALDAQKDIITEYGTGVSGTGGINSDIDITFAGWVEFPFLTDVFSTDLSVSNVHPFDVQTISGCVTPIYSDIYSTLLTTSGIKNDIYCSLMDMAVLLSDIETINGRVSYLTQDIYSTVARATGLTCDIGLYPLNITNFSLGVGEYTVASDYISVDVLDYIYEVVVSGTYFKVGGEEVSVTFSGIENGYRMFYDPVDDFGSLNGPTIFTARVENNNGDVLEKDYYLTFGYVVEYDNKPRIDVGFDYNAKVTVRVIAENYASCPKVTSDGHRFITEHRENVDLGASIIGMFHADDVSNLSAEIYPKSTAYFYGKEFTVVIKAKDFANNVMEPVILRYKIEDRPV